MNFIKFRYEFCYLIVGHRFQLLQTCENAKKVHSNCKFTHFPKTLEKHTTGSSQGISDPHKTLINFSDKVHNNLILSSL